MNVTLIITTYNWPESLQLVLESVNSQIIAPDQIIIADDGSTQETKNLISSFKRTSNLNIIHAWQEDSGFRAARSRNNAIAHAIGDYIILVDGDSILHKNFVLDHTLIAEPGYFVQGSRVLLSEKQTKIAIKNKLINFSFFSAGLKNRKNSIHSKLFSLIFSNKKNQLRGIKSHNMAFYKNDFMSVNGFNNDFEGWGREDSELIARMMNAGVKRKNIRFNAIQFHLWHNESSQKSLRKNDEMLKDVINNQIKWCDDGINSINKYES